MSNNKLYNDIYAVSFKRLFRLDIKKIDKETVEDTIKKSLEFLNIDVKNFKEFEKCSNELLKSFQTKTGSFATISNNEDHEEWYNPAKSRPYWDTHKEWLLEHSKKPLDVVSSIDKSTDEIIGQLENPERSGPWDRRGIVVGNIQSGKTSNFIALANKALDAGYKFIVVMSGLTKDLRRQTHERLDEGFFGFNTEHFEFDSFATSNILELGKIRKDILKRPNTYTSSRMNGDLSTAILRSTLNTHTEDATLFCIKKNKSTLQNLIRYVCKDPNISDKVIVEDKPFKIKSDVGLPIIKNKPILVIDDEVDHASVDTGTGAIDENDEPNEEYDPKTINSLIRQLLNLYERKNYVGYTATPFANVFIHPNEYTKEEGPGLFPKSFIHDLPEPSNYYGIRKLFSEESGDIDESFLEIIDDHCSEPEDIDCSEGWIPPKHYKDHEVLNDGKDEHPNSLKRSILSFIVSCSLRNLRGQVNEHKSMLIHVTKYIKVNEQIKFQIIRTIDKIRSILINPGTNEYNLLINEITDVLNNFSKAKQYNIQDILNSDMGIGYVVREISLNIKNLSGNSNDFLDYERYKKIKDRGLQTIVIGGDRLSRGITLEGLSVSYFLRSTKMYDTLMQMGRWFGYRDGYEDLCKLFTTYEMMDWFYHIAEATDQLKLQFRIMSEQNLTPQDFGLKVKSHPLLMITSRVKMQHGFEMKTSFVDHFGQTTSFDLASVDHNLKNTEKFVDTLGKPSEEKEIKRAYGNENNSFVWKKISSDKVLDFLNGYKIHKDSTLVKPHLYAEYIKNLNSINELEKWTVGLMGSGSTDDFRKINNSYEINLLKRKARKNEDTKYSIGILTNPNHQLLDLTDEQIIEIANKTSDKKEYGIRARQFRSPTNGLILLYPIKIPDSKKNKTEICFGFAISFPSRSRSRSDENNVTYVVNNRYFKQEYQPSSNL